MSDGQNEWREAPLMQSQISDRQEGASPVHNAKMAEAAALAAADGASVPESQFTDEPLTDDAEAQGPTRSMRHRALRKAKQLGSRSVEMVMAALRWPVVQLKRR